MKSFIKLCFKSQILHLIIPLIVLILFGFFIIARFNAYLKEVINFTLFTIIAFSVVSIFGKSVLKKGTLIFFVLLLHIVVLIKLSFYFNYEARINASAFYVIFETNNQESIGFITTYFTKFVIFLSIILAISLILFFKSIFKIKIATNDFFFYKNRAITLLLLATITTGAVYAIKYKLPKYNMIVSGITAFKDYNELKELIKKDLSKPYSDYVVVEDNPRDTQTHVIIIGESTSKWHMSLYNYPIETNPKLNKLKKELYIFKDVISPDVNTLTSLDKTLTFSDYHNPNKEKNTSVVQLANQAGFETYWISNQQAIGIYESFVTQIGYAADHKHFLASDDFTAISHDEIIFDKFNDILKSQKKSKVIFIHLIGTHGPYQYRYPESYNYFKESNEISVKNKTINNYDNAIRYNDYIVSSIISSVKKTNTKSSVVYFSDHGDDVYDTDKVNFLYHNEYQATKPMHEVPFILWLSKEYKTKKRDSVLNTYLNRKYILEDFEHTFSDLLEIKHNQFEPQKSILNKDFKQKIRLTGNGKNYDSVEK